MDTSQLYWLPFKQVYQQLQGANRSGISGLNELLNLNFQWLLDGLSKFSGPNEKSLSALKSGGALKASAWGAKRGIAVDKHLANATAELSQLLDLDELQCHLLLKRWLKDSETNITAPTATAAPAAAGITAALALPASAAAAGSTSAAASGPGQAVLPLEVVQAVADSYAQERIYLSKCQQFIVMTAMDVTADASKSCRDVLKRLLEASWEAKAFDCLGNLLKPRKAADKATGGGVSGSSTAAVAVVQQSAADSPHVVKPVDFEQRLHLHQLHERCELMCLLTQLYCGPDPSTSSSIHVLQEQLSQGAQDDGSSDAAAAAFGEVKGIKWPECSEERLQQLLELLGETVFVSGGAGAAGSGFGWKQRQQREGTAENQLVNMQQLAEALGCSLILSALKPAQLLNRLAAAAAVAGQGPVESLPASVCPFKQWRSIEAALMQWRCVPGSVLAMLVLFAYNQLLANYRGMADAISSSIQQHALQAGGFAAIAAPLAQEELAAGTLAGGLYRGLLLQGLCLMAAAFDLSPLHLPGPMLQQLVDLVVAVVQGSPQLAEQVWDESLKSTQPLRHLLDEASALFPAFPAPFLQLSTGLCQGRDAASAAYTYLCNKPCLTVEYDAAVTGVQRFQTASGEEAILHVHMPWAKAPEVQGSYLPEGSRGSVKSLPAFAQQPIPSDGAAAADQGSYLVAWDVQAEEGIGPVLLLARAAHCLQQLHVATVARQAVASSEYWQDLRLILQLLAALLKHEPLLAKPLLDVSIVYTSSQRMDWLDVIIASLNVLPGLPAATRAGVATSSAGTGGAQLLSSSIGGVNSRSTNGNPFSREVLAALGDCLVAAAAAATAQPSRVVAALGSCQLFAGVALAPEPLQLVSLEGLASWVHGQQTAEQTLGSTEDWRTLETLQALQESIEMPNKSYPLTEAVLHLVQSLLDQQCTWGMVPSLVSYILHRVLGAMPWLPFSCGAARMSLAASALKMVRAAVMSGAVARPGAAGPKAAGAPGGLLVTVLAAKVIHEMATAGHGYLSSVLPPPADILRDMAEQQAGSSQLLAAGTELAEALLLLVPVLLGAAAHLSPEMPLQQYWGVDPPNGGMSPAAIIASYATYPYAPHLPLLALEVLNAFAILQAGPASAAASGLGFSGAPPPSSGGPPVPTSAVAPAGLGPLTGPVQSWLNPMQPYAGGYHSSVAAGLGVAGRGGAAGWRRPSGLFAALLAAVPQLRASLLRPFNVQVAQEYPEWAIKSMALLEAGVRSYPEMLDSLCFPCGLKPPQAAAEISAAGAKSDTSAGTKPGTGTSSKGSELSKTAFSALDGLWQLLKQASSLLASQPKLLAAVLHVLSTLWECQGSAHGAVELLRSQPGFWPALKACLPLQGSLPSVAAGQDDSEAAAWKLQVHASALHILLLELLSVQVNSVDAASGGQAKASTPAGHEPLLAALGPKELMKLLASAADLGLQQPLMDQLARMLQVSYLQLGGSAVIGAWGPASLRTDALSIAAQFRAEVQPLLAAAASGEYTLEDLNVACNMLADPEQGAAAAYDAGDDDAMETDGTARSRGARGAVLVDSLYARPFGEALLSYAAVTSFSWAAGETEYGRQFLFDSGRLLQLLGPFIIDELEGPAALAITLDDISAAAAAAHARLALLQAATSLFASLSRHAPARQQLLSTEVSRDLLAGSVQSVEAAMSEACRLSSCPAARLLSVPWGLPFIGHACSTALLLASRSMLLSVRLWKVAAAAAAATAGAVGGSGNSGGQHTSVTSVTTGRPVLMARSLNEQQVGGLSTSGKGVSGAGSAGGAGGVAPSGDAVTLAACAKCAVLLSQWLRGKGGESLAETAAAAAAAAGGSSKLDWEEAAGAVSGAVAADVEIVECLSTSLLLMLQALPGCQHKTAAATRQKSNGVVSPRSSNSKQAGAKSVAAGDAAGNSNMIPAELLELETALLDLLPALCKACAGAVHQQQSQQQQQQWWDMQGPSAAAAGATASRQAYAAAMLQLLIEILQHQLPASVWLGAVSQQLALVPMLTAAATRAGRCGLGANPVVLESVAAAAANANSTGTAVALANVGQQGASAAAAAAAAAAERGAAAAAAAAAAGAAVTDISVLELASAVAQVPEGALQLWQQGLVPVLVAYCRELMHTERSTGLLDIASLGLVGPTAGVYGAEVATACNALTISAQMELSLSTLGAYMSTSSSSAGSSSVQTVKGLTGATAAAAHGSSSSGASAAAAGCMWSPRHQQWCLLLGLLSTLLQQLSKTTAVVDIALQLLIAVEPRLLLAVQMQNISNTVDASHQQGLRGVSALGQSSQQPHGALALAWGSPGALSGLGLGMRHHADGPMLLTLANLLEAERALYLLKFMVPHLGVWQLQRPGSLTAFRAAVARLVEFVAAPSVDRSFRVSCAPLSPFERRLAKLPSGLEASDGWFKVCSAGGANNLPQAAAASTPTTAAASPTAAGAASPGSPAASLGAIITAGAFSGSPRAAAAADSAGGLTAPGGVGGCSEYCARLCEAVYTVCEHSLAFLLMTAPVVEAGEVSTAAGEGLGATWPAAKALTALQDQVLAVGTSMVQHPQAISLRRRRVAASCVRIAAAAGQLLDAVAPQRWSAGTTAGRRGIDAAAEAARRHERMTNIARAATAGL